MGVNEEPIEIDVRIDEAQGQLREIHALLEDIRRKQSEMSRNEGAQSSDKLDEWRAQVREVRDIARQIPTPIDHNLRSNIFGEHGNT